MKVYQGFLTGNLVLDLGIFAWFVAQVIKVVLQAIFQRKFEIRTFVSSGGMPSSHSALVCAMAAAIGALYGWRGPLFALAAGIAAVVMYDAFNVRRAAGEQAKVLNYLLTHLDQMSSALAGKALKELLGHTPLQVLMGAVLGSGIGLLALLTK